MNAKIYFSDVNERNDWVEAINSAIEEYNSKKASFLKDPQGSLDLSAGEALGDSAPVWIPDQRVCMCQLCAVQFSLVVRRHHCRACGKVVCSSCSNNKAPIKYRQFETVRVCHLCYDILKKSKISLPSPSLSLYILNIFPKPFKDSKTAPKLTQNRIFRNIKKTHKRNTEPES